MEKDTDPADGLDYVFENAEEYKSIGKHRWVTDKAKVVAISSDWPSLVKNLETKEVDLRDVSKWGDMEANIRNYNDEIDEEEGWSAEQYLNKKYLIALLSAMPGDTVKISMAGVERTFPVKLMTCVDDKQRERQTTALIAPKTEYVYEGRFEKGRERRIKANTMYKVDCGMCGWSDTYDTEEEAEEARNDHLYFEGHEPIYIRKTHESSGGEEE